MPLSKIQTSSSTGRRNLIINGAMQLFQRATAATAAASGYNTVDRFRGDTSTDGAFTTEKSTDNPFGTGSSLKAQVTTADTSLAASQYARIIQRIEAQNLQHLLYGTSSAKTLTLSFWVKSNKTGIYSIVLVKPDNTTYHFTHEYTISSANTWEKKVITITPTAGSTSFITASAGAIANDNGIGFELSFGLGQGSNFAIGTSNTWSSNTSTFASTNQVNWMDNTSNNFYLTQVQLEVGNLTDFEHRSFGEELELCQRYYQNSFEHGNAPGTSTDSDDTQLTTSWTDGNAPFPPFPTTMRAKPTVTLRPRGSTSTGSINNGGVTRNASATNISNKGVSYIGVTSGTGGQYNAFSYECSAEI